MALVALAAFLLVPSALAGTVTNDRPLLFAFDGADSSIGPLSAPSAIALDEATGAVYVNNMAGSGKGPGLFDAQRVVCKFNAEGEAQNFTAGSSAGKSCLDGKDVPGEAFGVAGDFAEVTYTADVAVDNSGGAGGLGEGEQGRLYLSEQEGPIHAFAPDGAHLWTLPRATARPCGIAVDAEGHLWVGNGAGSGEARFEALEFDNHGSPPAQIGSIAMTNSTKRPCRLAIDLSGKNLYAGLAPELPSGVDKYVEGKYHSSFSAGYRFDVTIDQSQLAGHIMMSDGESFEEYKPCVEPLCPGIQVAGSPFGRDLIGTARGIAYNPTLDWVYISDLASDTVKVFGPLTSGTVPDVTSEETEPVGLHTATAKGTINPLGLPNSYHFEWKPGTGASWGAAESSPRQSIEPSDSSPHPVSFTITEYKGKALRSNTTYQVRLVATNTENDLDAYSGADTFTTLVPPPPVVEDCATSALSTEAAHLECDVDPEEEEVTWKVLASAQTAASQAECEALSEGQFQVVKEGTIPPEEPGSVEIEADLSGLLAAQTYCVRVIATNPGGSGKEDLTFTTLAIPPSEAAAAFAAPRTDTSARINARVNPNGETDLSYRFELSEDGATWTPLPIRTSTADAREPILVAEELTGLMPDTEYHYRFQAENEAGQAPSLGTVRTFTTRTSAEVQAAESLPGCPNADVRAAQQTEYLGSCRAVELVNNPDKGNQSPFVAGPFGSSPVISADGEKVLWSVPAGAPEGPNGTEPQFLAERGPGGWRSESVNPPVEEQVGGGELRYRLGAVTPDFRAFVFAVGLSTGLASPAAPTMVRVREGGQDVLKSYEADPPNNIYEESIEVSEDGEHVLFLDGKTKQLEDIGAARVGPPAVGAEVVSLMPNDLPSACGLDAFGGESFVLGAMHQPGYRWAAASDASRVYFRAPANGDCGGLYRLWVRDREAGTTEAGTTVEIDAGALGESPEFIRATPDGRSAYFLTLSDLDPEDTDGDLSGPERDVYRWEEEAGESSCLTCVLADANLAGAPAGGVAAVLGLRGLLPPLFPVEREIGGRRNAGQHEHLCAERGRDRAGGERR